MRHSAVNLAECRTLTRHDPRGADEGRNFLYQLMTMEEKVRHSTAYKIPGKCSYKGYDSFEILRSGVHIV